MRERNIVIFMLFAVLTLTLGCTKHDRSEEADRVTDELKGLMFKNPEQALARVDSAEQAGVFSASDANLLRVNIYWNIGQKRMAAFYGEQALADSDVKRKSKTYYSALMLMVKWYEENGEYGKANEMADEILADVERDTSQMALTMRSSALTRKAECEIHTGHPDEAERLYLESIDILMKGMEHPKSYWEIDPLFYNILETSDFYLEHGKPEKALELIAKGDTALARLECSPEVPDKVLQFRRNNVTISQAMVYAANGQRDKAETLYLKHRQTEGLSHTDIFVEGRYLAMTDRYDEAIRLYRQSDSIYRAAGGSLSSAYINARMSLEYDVLQKAGRTAEASPAVQLWPDYSATPTACRPPSTAKYSIISPDETGRNAFFPNLRHTFPPVRHRSCWRFVILRQISEQYGNIICHSSSLGRRRHRGAPGSGGRRRLSAVAHLRQQCTPEIVSRREHGNARQIAGV